ncbi:MAG: hypothetical protein OXM01_16615 [Gemmatimonadota bacterium]|nr:hypothetical protein [Gemmatimonadota bacterium]
MSTPQPSPELTTRDVLQQIDHRLSLIEMDVRENHTKIEAKIDALDSKFEAKIDAFDRKFEGKIDALDSKVEDKFNAFNNKFEGRIDALDNKVEGKIEVEIRELRREFNGKFNLVIGLVITSWLSMMGTLLFKL